jgi:L-fucose isomerase-like protein
MDTEKTTFALFFGNRGFFPASLLESARDELSSRLQELGYSTLMMPADATRHGAVETPEEGRKYAAWLRENRGRYGGIVLSLPNFGDENGAVAALRDAGVPILIQAYPDELTAMAPDQRRDAFCGKFSIMDVFHQHGIRFTALKPHVVAPASDRFAEQVAFFDRVCRVTNGMRDLVVGAVGARTTAFKTVRVDELALQAHGITVETLDLADVFARMRAVDPAGARARGKQQHLERYSSWQNVPEHALATLVQLAVAVDDVIDEYRLDALALRCWIEMQQQLGISPCVLLSELNDRGIPAACEVDIANAVAMAGLRLASGDVTACLDWNNNYGDDEDKCILFHCGSAPRSMMAGPGQVVDHAILANAVGEGRGFGCNVGRIRPTEFTFGSMLTEDGRLEFYLGSGRFTSDPIPPEFFGCAGVAHIEGLQDVLQTIGYAGHRHHVSVTPAAVLEPVHEAMTRYLGYSVTVM